MYLSKRKQSDYKIFVIGTIIITALVQAIERIYISDFIAINGDF